jgi:hypothetical protein
METGTISSTFFLFFFSFQMFDLSFCATGILFHYLLEFGQLFLNRIGKVKKGVFLKNIFCFKIY